MQIPQINFANTLLISQKFCPTKSTNTLHKFYNTSTTNLLPGGAWVFSIGAVLFAAMTGLMAANADYSLWRDEAVLAPFLLVICGVLVFRHRK